MMQTAQQAPTAMSGGHAELLMRELAAWKNTTTIIFQGGCVFEFKGVFPAGHVSEGYYNLSSGGDGFEGHIKLDAVNRIAFQSREHRGRESHAFIFENDQGEAIFKVFLGRDSEGSLWPEQVTIFNKIQSTLAL